MNTLTITRDIMYKDGSSNPLTIIVDADGCEVKYLTAVAKLSWSEIANVDLLAEVFGELPVRVFRVIVELLAHCYVTREHIKGLL